MKILVPTKEDFKKVGGNVANFGGGTGGHSCGTGNCSPCGQTCRGR